MEITLTASVRAALAGLANIEKNEFLGVTPKRPEWFDNFNFTAIKCGNIEPVGLASAHHNEDGLKKFRRYIDIYRHGTPLAIIIVTCLSKDDSVEGKEWRVEWLAFRLSDSSPDYIISDYVGRSVGYGCECGALREFINDRVSAVKR